VRPPAATDPPGHPMGLSGPYYFSRPFRAAPRQDGPYFLFRRISPSRWSLALPSHCIRILLSSLSIFNLLSHISGPPVRAALRSRRDGGGEAGGRRNNANMEARMWENLAKVLARRRFRLEEPDAIRSWQKERTRSAKRSSSSSLRLGSA